MKVKIIDIESIYPHEHTDNNHVKLLKEKILTDGYWTKPIIVDKNSQILMDGHHRLEVAKSLNLNNIPCYELSYNSNNIEIKSWSDNHTINYHDIISMVKRKKYYPIKTTRHIFKMFIPETKIALSTLY